MTLPTLESSGGGPKGPNMRRRLPNAKSFFSGYNSRAKTLGAFDETTLLLQQTWPNDNCVRYLLRLYKVFSRSKTSESLNETVWLSTADAGHWQAKPDETSSESFNRIFEILRCDPSKGLLICGSSASDEKVHKKLKKDRIGNIFRVEDNTWAFVRLMLSCLVELSWEMTPNEHAFMRQLEHRAVLPVLHFIPALREQYTALGIPCNAEPGGEVTKLPSKLSDSFALQLRWQRDAPKYHSGVDFFTRQPFDQRPVLECLQILFLKSRKDDERKVFLITSSTVFLRRLSATYEQKGPCRRCFFTTDAQVMSLILAISRRLLLDAITFLHQSYIQRERMALSARKSPNMWKTNYVLHLQECLEVLAEQCDKANTQFEHLLSLPPSPREEIMTDICALLKTDIDEIHLASSQMRKLAEELTLLKDKIVEQMDLSRNFWNGVLGFFVAIYVPLSFASSFFGMNIAAPNNEANGYWSNTTTYPPQDDTVPSSVGNQSLASGTSKWIVTNAAENQSWSYGAFWATAVPLLFASIIIPTVGGSVSRQSVLFWRKGKGRRRMVIKTALFVIAFAGLGVGVFYGTIGVQSSRASALLRLVVYGAISGAVFLMCVLSFWRREYKRWRNDRVPWLQRLSSREAHPVNGSAAQTTS